VEAFDPLWRLRRRLTESELRLLRSPPLARLRRIRHAGAAWLTTPQGHSRLEHTVAVFLLVCRFRPDDEVMRAAALLHDVGHLPLSHTLEGVAGMDHHALAEARLREQPVREALAAGGLDPEHVAAVALGHEPTLLRPAGRRLGLDHLESLLRSAHVHGWSDVAPHQVLAEIVVGDDGALDGPPRLGDELARLIALNAASQADPVNVGPVGIARGLVRDLLDTDGAVRPNALAAMADDELWAVLLAHPRTAAGTRRLLAAPFEIVARAVDGEVPVSPPLREVVRDARYVTRPASALSPAGEAALAAAAATATRFAVGWPEDFAGAPATG
jgi:hypothetical protein